MVVNWSVRVGIRFSNTSVTCEFPLIFIIPFAQIVYCNKKKNQSWESREKMTARPENLTEQKAHNY